MLEEQNVVDYKQTYWILKSAAGEAARHGLTLVIENQGARVYLEPQAAAYLEDKVLDAQVDGQSKAHFFLGEKETGPA